MAAVSICSDFGAQENKVCHYFHCSPICLPWSDGSGCHELLDVQARTRDQIANMSRLIEKARTFQKIIYFCFIDYTKAFGCVDHNKLENSKEMGIPDHLTCLLRSLYAGQVATVRTGHVMTDWFQIGKGVCQGCILSLCLFNLLSSCHCCQLWMGQHPAFLEEPTVGSVAGV